MSRRAWAAPARPREPSNPGISLQAYVEALLREKDLRDQQRFEAQSEAVGAALASQQTASQAALAAAEKAVTKAETAAEKRFEALNEFRGAVQDIVAQQMPRGEAESRFAALSEKIDELKTTAAGRDGQTAGAQTSRSEDRLDRGSLISLLALLASVTAIIVVIVHK